MHVLGAEACLPVVCCQEITSGGQVTHANNVLDPVLDHPDLSQGLVVRLAARSQHFVPLRSAAKQMPKANAKALLLQGYREVHSDQTHQCTPDKKRSGNLTPCGYLVTRLLQVEMPEAVPDKMSEVIPLFCSFEKAYAWCVCV